MKKLRVGGQSIMEYLLILVVVAIASIAFAKNVLYDKDGKFKFFNEYFTNAKAYMQGKN